MICVKIHRSYRDVVAICDSELLGKRFEEPFQDSSGQQIKQLDIRESFYKGEETDHQKAVSFIKSQAKEDATFNIVGPDSIKAALEAGIIKKEGIDKIDGVPYALSLL